LIFFFMQCETTSIRIGLYLVLSNPPLPLPEKKFDKYNVKKEGESILYFSPQESSTGLS
jgi:hypothetical protein